MRFIFGKFGSNFRRKNKVHNPIKQKIMRWNDNHVNTITIKWTICHNQGKNPKFYSPFCLILFSHFPLNGMVVADGGEIFAFLVWEKKNAQCGVCVSNKFLCSSFVGELWILTTFNVIICLRHRCRSKWSHPHILTSELWFTMWNSKWYIILYYNYMVNKIFAQFSVFRLGSHV